MYYNKLYETLLCITIIDQTRESLTQFLQFWH